MLPILFAISLFRTLMVSYNSSASLRLEFAIQATETNKCDLILFDCSKLANLSRLVLPFGGCLQFRD